MSPMRPAAGGESRLWDSFLFCSYAGKGVLFMGYYSVNLPSYTIGEGCYGEIPKTARFLGKTAVVIGGKTAMAKAR